MTDNEILLNLSNMLDPIQEEIRDIKRDIKEIRGDITGIKGEIVGMKDDITDIKGDITEMKDDITEMKDDITDIKARVKRLELTQENVVIPRLNTIESCYISTYERYKENVDEHEMLKQDVSILKKVVTEHSIKLQGAV